MKIKVEPLLPTSPYLNCRIGIERDYPDDANEADVINQTWDNLIAIHMKRYPHLYNEDGTPKYEGYKGEEMRGTHVRDIVEEPVDKIKGMVEVINLCSTKVALERFYPQVQRIDNQELTEAYNNKLKQLQ